MSEHLLAYLKDHDAPCPICRYNLRGLTVDRCPECAAPLRLAVASPNLHLGPLVLTIVSFALAAGFDLVVGLMMGTATIIHANMAAAATWIAPALVSSTLTTIGLTCVGCIILLVRMRHRWHRIPTKKQWIVGAAVFVLVGLLHAGLGALLISIIN